MSIYKRPPMIVLWQILMSTSDELTLAQDRLHQICQCYQTAKNRYWKTDISYELTLVQDRLKAKNGYWKTDIRFFTQERD